MEFERSLSTSCSIDRSVDGAGSYDIRLTEATERDLYWEWVRAEADAPRDTPRYQDRLRHGLDERLLSLLEGGASSRLSDSDWDRLRQAFRRLRDGYLDPLLGPGTRWFYGNRGVHELGQIRIPNLTISPVPLALSRRLQEYVEALDAGRETPRLPNLRVYRHLRRAFDPARMRGCPILISDQPVGP